MDPSSIDSYRRGGVRTISDFRELWRPYYDAFNNSPENHKGKIQRTSEDWSKIRQNKALQLRSTPEYLDTLYASTFTGPNLAIIENYWNHLRKTTQQRQSTALEDERIAVRSLVTKAQINIFQEISKYNLHDRTRKILGEIARILDPDVYLDYLDPPILEQQPGISSGVAWWLSWVSEDDQENNNYIETACEYYEQAAKDLSANPKVIYETARFCVDKVGNHEKAQEHIKKALQFFKNEGKNEFTILSIVVSAWVHAKANSPIEAGKNLADAMEFINSFDELTCNMKDLNEINQVILNIEGAFEDKQTAAIFRELKKAVREL